MGTTITTCERAALMTLPMLTVKQAAGALGMGVSTFEILLKTAAGPRTFELRGKAYCRPTDLHDWTTRLTGGGEFALGEDDAIAWLKLRGVTVSKSWMRKARLSGRGPEFIKIKATGGICYPIDELAAWAAEQKAPTA